MRRCRVPRADAWGIPAVVAKVATRASVLSPVLPVLEPPSTWTNSHTGTLAPASTGPYYWDSSGRFGAYRDNGSTAEPLTFATATSIATIVGATYTAWVPITWGYGDGAVHLSTGASAQVVVDGRRVLDRPTRRRDGLGLRPNTTTYPVRFTATSASTTLELRAVLSARTARSNDDVLIAMPHFTSCCLPE
ncbi:hypothetical protein BCF74_13625 [Knoellia remsis]|uniref:PA14 domain-containing protein n=1 Tax=Knoellia remsis TaxID=407159 RepID=A0A2T0U0H5_9MICO|nr:hypothetical protein BCF74_13625 [Knoellia remsis]